MGPPGFIAEYLAAEQLLGRVRADVVPEQAAVVILATLFELSLQPSDEGTGVDRHLLAATVRLLLARIEPRPRPGREPGSTPCVGRTSGDPGGAWSGIGSARSGIGSGAPER